MKRRTLFIKRVVIVPEEQINHLLVALLGDVEWMPCPTLIVVEAEDVDAHTQLILDCWDVFDGDWVCDVVQSILMEEVDVIARSVWVLFI